MISCDQAMHLHYYQSHFKITSHIQSCGQNPLSASQKLNYLHEVIQTNNVAAG